MGAQGAWDRQGSTIAPAPVEVVLTGPTPLGYQQITISAGVVSLSPPAQAVTAIIYVEGNGVRWRDDGTAPTSSVGMPLSSGQAFAYSAALSAIQFAAQLGAPILNVSYYK